MRCSSIAMASWWTLSQMGIESRSMRHSSRKVMQLHKSCLQAVVPLTKLPLRNRQAILSLGLHQPGMCCRATVHACAGLKHEWDLQLYGRLLETGGGKERMTAYFTVSLAILPSISYHPP